MERKQMANYLIPAAAVALLVALVGAIVAGGNNAAPTKTHDGKPVGNPAAGAEGMVAEKPDPAAPEWKDLGDGLKFWDTVEGTGDAVRPGQTVTCYYTGWLLSGKSFDGNRTGSPISFGLNQVIKGWTDGIPGMKPGGIRRLYIPAKLGYGSQDKGSIPPNSDLVFEVKLVSVSH